MITNKVFIIAEIGVNHNGKISIAKKLIDVAKNCGADAVKFQTFKAENLAFKNTPKVKYQTRRAKKSESHFQMLKNLELDKKKHRLLINYCKKKKIEFMSTPYDVRSAKFLKKCGITKFKTASADVIDFFLHEYLSKHASTVIISTGMSSISEVKVLMSLYKKSRAKIALLHCVSSYPCSNKSLNLNNIMTLKKFKTLVGYSDHSKKNLSSLVAVGLGARILERHITLNKKLKGPDHFASDNPKEFKKYVAEVRNVEEILGSFYKKPQPEEKQMRLVSRKGLYYKDDFRKGKLLRKNNLKLLRPWNKLSLLEMKKIFNKKLTKNVKKNNPVKKNDFKKQ